MKLPDPPMRPTVLPPLLTVQPDQIQHAIDAFNAADDQLTDLISDGRRALVFEPWMGDPVSARLAQAMTEQHTVGPNSIIGVLEAYKGELKRVVDTLTEMLNNYQRTDGEAAGDIRR